MGSTGAIADGAGTRRGEITPTDLGELLAAFNDVTARLQESHDRLHREVARLNGELAEANARVERSRRLAALGEMAAGIAHEVRNPLGSIRLYARLLDQDLADRAPERDLVRKVSMAAGAIDAIVGDVLRFAREFRLEPRDVGAAELVDRALELCHPGQSASWGGVRVERVISPGVSLRVDPGLAAQAVANVLRNAFEAIAERTGDRAGTVTIEAAPAERALGDGRPGAVVRVIDTGPGIGAEVIPRMFNPFFTTRGTGTGLGLSIVHRIIDAHGGSITIRNRSEGRPGATGAVVEMVFPTSEGEAVGPRPGASAGRGSGASGR